MSRLSEQEFAELVAGNPDLRRLNPNLGFNRSVRSPEPDPLQPSDEGIPAQPASKAAKSHARKPALAMSEADLQTSVIDLAHLYKWKVAHFRSVKVTRKDGTTFWQTPVQADGEGFVDLVLCRAAPEGPGRVIFAELKSERGKIEPTQREWLNLLTLTKRVEVYTWRPSDWLSGKVDQLLR